MKLSHVAEFDIPNDYSYSEFLIVKKKIQIQSFERSYKEKHDATFELHSSAILR